jgi:hypothetical protein
VIESQKPIKIISIESDPFDTLIILEKHNFRCRQAFKVEAGKKNIPQRDEQFKNIEDLKQQYTSAGNPVLSMDVKKKN